MPTEKALAFALAHQVMKLVPLEYVTASTGKKRAVILSRRDREEIGEYIRRSLGLLYTNMVSSINEKEDRERTFVNEMGRGLSENKGCSVANWGRTSWGSAPFFSIRKGALCHLARNALKRFSKEAGSFV